MAVKITEDMYDTFTNNGYTQDDIQNTVSHYRDQGMPDSAIFTNLNKRYRDLANIKDVSTPQIGDQPNYDAILNDPSLTPQQQGEQIKQKGEAYRSNLDQQLPADIAKNTLQGYVNNAGDFGKGLLQGVSSLGVGLGKNVINPLRTNLGKQPLTDEQLNNLYGVLAQKPTSLSGQVGKGIGEVLPYLTLPEATPFKGAGVASTLGNLGVTGAYQGALANTLSSLANKGISPDTLRDMATGAGTGALLNVGLGSALRYGLPRVFPKLAQEIPQEVAQTTERPIGLSQIREMPTVGEAPIQQLAPNKFAIEADTNVETQPEINAVEQPQAQQPQVSNNEVVFRFSKNTEKAPNMGTTFAQDIEPSGEYINLHKKEWGEIPNFEYGEIKFKNPLILEHKTTGHGGWKTDLSNMYGGKTGKKLSNAIKKDGYDGIITTDPNGDYNEIVNLSGEKLPIGSQSSNAPEMVQPQVQVPQGEVKTRGGIKTIG